MGRVGGGLGARAGGGCKGNLVSPRGCVWGRWLGEDFLRGRGAGGGGGDSTLGWGKGMGAGEQRTVTGEMKVQSGGSQPMCVCA